MQDEIFEGEIKLTPIQRWYLNNFKNEPSHWHLGVRFDLDTKFSQAVLSEVIKAIVERHESLRLKFEPNDFQSAQAVNYQDSYLRIVKPGIEVFSDSDQFVQSVVKSECMDAALEKGNLFKCIYIENSGSGKSSLVLLAHHLVVDQISWNILIEEITTAISQRQQGKEIDLGAKSISYGQWAQRLHDHLQSKAFVKDFKYWANQFKNQIPKVSKDYKVYKERDVVRFKHRLDPEITSQVIMEAPQKFDAKVSEVLMAALMNAMYRWKGKTALTIETEGHGREPLDNEITFHNSVGWFTSLYPIFLEVDKDRDSQSNLQYIKNKMRSIPSKGLTFGMCKFLNEEIDGISEFEYSADVLMNYLGKSTMLESKILGKGIMLEEFMRSKEAERLHPIEINIYLDGDELVFDCSYVSSFTNGVDFSIFLDAFKEELINISKQTVVTTTHNYVPADFQEVDFDEDDLNALFDQL
jgi:non-ribosomal peptide synthase protein (TIGR01720 family)